MDPELPACCLPAGAVGLQGTTVSHPPQSLNRGILFIHVWSVDAYFCVVFVLGGTVQQKWPNGLGRQRSGSGPGRAGQAQGDGVTERNGITGFGKARTKKPRGKEISVFSRFLLFVLRLFFFFFLRFFQWLQRDLAQ